MRILCFNLRGRNYDCYTTHRLTSYLIFLFQSPPVSKWRTDFTCLRFESIGGLKRNSGNVRGCKIAQEKEKNLSFSWTWTKAHCITGRCHNWRHRIHEVSLKNYLFGLWCKECTMSTGCQNDRWSIRAYEEKMSKKLFSKIVDKVCLDSALSALQNTTIVTIVSSSFNVTFHCCGSQVTGNNYGEGVGGLYRLR